MENKKKTPWFWVKTVGGTLVAILIIVVIASWLGGKKEAPVPAPAETAAVVAPAPVVELPETVALRKENELMKNQLRGMETSLQVSRESEMPEGVKVTHMPERTLKESPWKFLKWDKQGKYTFPLIANSTGNPTPIRSALPPPPGSIPGKALPGERWTLADWDVTLPDGTQLALNGWARE
jgi:hypothetical protein